MTQKNIKIFINEIYFKPPKKKYSTNKTDVYHIDDIWSFDILDLKDYGPKNNKGYRYVLVIIDIFSESGWTTTFENKNAQIIKDSLEIILISSNSKPNLIESDRGKEFCNNIFQDFLKKAISKFNLGTVHMVPSLQNALIVLSEIYLKRLFLKRVMVNGLMYYPKKQNNIIIEYIRRLS